LDERVIARQHLPLHISSTCNKHDIDGKYRDYVAK